MREFQLPDVGEGIREAEIVEWLVGVGDTVEEDQPVVEIETDKALVEVPSPVDGTVAEIRAEPGQIVPVGEVIIVFEEAADAAESAVAGRPEGGEGEVGRGAEPVGHTEAAGSTGGRAGRVFAPPHVRRLARELGVDLAAVEGTGANGRVTEGDVRAAAEGAKLEPAAPPVDIDETEAPSGRSPARRTRTLAAPATRRLAEELGVDLDVVPAVEERDGEAFVTPDAVRAFADSRASEHAVPRGGEERVPYRGLRRRIGEQMERSAFTIPHVTHFDEADASALVEAREQLQPAAEERGVRLTYLPFVMKAVVEGLREHPALNATLDEEAEEIVLHGVYNIGFATATDDGLLVPVVDDVDAKGLFELAAEIGPLAEKARVRSITREEMQGGTFTITNFGAIGGEYGTPIINHPEVAILGLGTIERRPRVVVDEVVPRYTLPLSLSFDHRVTDGATAATFTNRVIELLEHPLRLFVD